jgi:hypothetical protein
MGAVMSREMWQGVVPGHVAGVVDQVVWVRVR